MRMTSGHFRMYPDGSLLLMAQGDSLSGPGDCFGNLHVNSTSSFVCLLGGRWTRTDDRSLHRLWKAADSFATAQEAFDALTREGRDARSE